MYAVATTEEREKCVSPAYGDLFLNKTARTCSSYTVLYPKNDLALGPTKISIKHCNLQCFIENVSPCGGVPYVYIYICESK